MRELRIVAFLLALVVGCGPEASSDHDAGVLDAELIRADAELIRADAGRTDGGQDALRDSSMGDAGPPPACDAPIPALAATSITGDARFADPLFVTQPPGSTDLFVVERAGTIRIVRGGAILERPFLDLRATIGGPPTRGEEWGLLGLAFHPDYTANGRFFVTYTPLDGDNVLAEGARSANPDEANSVVTPILVIDDFAPNHNGGMIAFGADGFLYYGTGDGGGGGDPRRTAQDLGSLLGKILRLDVQVAGSYGSPASNPFATLAGARGETWAYGLRNPWRFSFDRATGDLWIGDVGQDLWEEIDHATPERAKGANFGWSRYEGTHEYPGGPLVGPSAHQPPIHEYSHEEGSSVVGGYVYRGRAIPALFGAYLFADSYSDFVRAMRVCEGVIMRAPEDVGGLGAGPIPGAGLVSFGEDNDGELYLVYLGSGQVMRIVQAQD